MRTTLDFADVTITIDPKEAAAGLAMPAVLSTVSEMAETLAQQTETIQRQSALIARLLEERRTIAVALTAISAHS